MFKYESQIEHTSKVQLQPLIDYLYSVLDGHILDQLGNIHSYDTLQGIVNNNILLSMFRNNRPRSTTIQQTLYNYNYFEITYPIYRNLLLNEPFLNNNYYTRNYIEHMAQIHALNESKLQYNYLNQCMDFIDSQSFGTKLDTKQYLKLINNNPNDSRYKMVTQTLIDGNIERYYNHLPRMDMNLLTTDTAGYLKNAAQYDIVTYVNENATQLGMNKPYISKSWIWSGKLHTRHRWMDGVTVPIDEPFQVTNERTGEMCNLRYPRDYTRDSTGSNTVNCGCRVRYNVDKDNKTRKMNG